MKSFTATDIRLFLECEYMFYLKNKENKKPYFKNGRGIGTCFHSLTSVLPHMSSWVNQHPLWKQDINSDIISMCLIESIYKNHFYPFIKNESEESIYEWMEAWKSFVDLLEYWGKELYENLQHTQIEKLIEESFPKVPKILEQIISYKNQQYLLKGEPDTIFRSLSKNRWTIAEYKTYLPQNDTSVKAQAACYAMLWSLQLQKQPVDALMLFASENIHPFYLQHHYLEECWNHSLPEMLFKMDSILENKIKPIPQNQLCPQCIHQKICPQNSSTPLSATSSIPAPHDEKINEKLSKLCKDLIKLLETRKLSTTLISADEGHHFYRIVLQPEKQTPIAKFMKLGPDLKVHLKLLANPLISLTQGVCFDIPKTERTFPHFESYYPFQKNHLCHIPIGVDFFGKLKSIYLNDSNTCHVLVAGSTGCGKSTLLRTMMISLALQSSPDELQFLIIDPKRVSFTDMEHLP